MVIGLAFRIVHSPVGWLATEWASHELVVDANRFQKVWQCAMIGEWGEPGDRVGPHINEQFDLIVEKQGRERLPSMIAVADCVDLSWQGNRPW